MKNKFLAGLGILSMPFVLYAQENELSGFNPVFFSGTNIDIASLSAENQMKAGVYDVDLYENGKFIGIHTITLKKNAENKTLIYFDKSILQELSLKEDINNHYQKMSSDQIVLDNDKLHIKAKFDISSLSINIIVPQLFLSYKPRGYVDPAYWQEGETAAILNYTSSYYHSEHNMGYGKYRSDNFFSSMNLWFNAGAWQFRNTSTIMAGNTVNRFDTQRTYVQRDLAKIYSIMKLGEVDYQQSILPTMSVLGMTLSSDQRMLPDSQRGYVPDIRGIANSNAKVTVRQNGNVLYETTVPPGPFLISDLYQATYGGDFNVTVQEADGTERKFTVPYAYLPDLMRPNQSKYSLALGVLNDNGLRKKPFVSSLTYSKGLSNLITGFTGTQISEYYQSGLIGLALNTGLGAISTSIAFSNANLGYKRSQGHNIGVSYSNVINDINTSISLATYHYSSSGFSSLQDAVRSKDAYDHHELLNINDYRSVNMKNSVQLSITQPLGDIAEIYASASFNDYWSYSKSDSSYQVGLSSSYNLLNYTLSAAKTLNSYSGNNETQYQLNFSYPLGTASFAPRMTTAYSHSSDGSSYLSNSLYGTALQDRSLSYGLSTNVYTSGNQATNISGNVSKLTASGNRSATASYDKNTRQYSLGMTGSAALHSGGVTFGQYTGDTVAIIYAEGAKDATVSGNPNIRIDSRGYAIYPYLSPYRDNNISLDPNSASTDLEIKNTSRHTSPLAGAIVKVKFDTITGDIRVFEVKYKGQNIPLGATASRNGSMVGLTGGSGMLMLRENENARIDISWVDNNDVEQTCYFNMEKKKLNNSVDLIKQLVNCI